MSARTAAALDAARAVEARADRELSLASLMNPAAIAWLEDDFDQRWAKAEVQAEGICRRLLVKRPEYMARMVSVVARDESDGGYSRPMLEVFETHDEARCSWSVCAQATTEARERARERATS